MMDWIVS